MEFFSLSLSRMMSSIYRDEEGRMSCVQKYVGFSVLPRIT